jgi:pilus assembly protein Flp/PilA
LNLTSQSEINLPLIIMMVSASKHLRIEVVMRYLSSISRIIARWLKVDSERGVTAIEYGLLAALIALAIIGAVTLVGTNLSTTFTTIAGKVGGAPAE